MNDLFKINVYFDEKGEKIENIISRFLIDILEKKNIISIFEFSKKVV